MGLQGNKATHDFLSLYAPAAKESSLPQLPGSKPPPKPPAQGFFLRTHDFLQPLERPSQSPPPPPPPPSHPDNKQQLHSQHALPGGVGTFSISHAPAIAAAAVKQEPPFALQWGAAAADPRGHQWTLPFATRGSSRAQKQQPTERKCGGGFMDAASGSSGGAGFDDEDGLAARREVSSSLKELAVRVDAKGGSCSGSAGTDQLPNTPRSKHSATEQRRRSKINDRFQLLREILPHNDQKRDKASFLLEVIEYIRFLQEKVQKYEVSCPEWNQENAKMVPWANMYFRSFWKNGQNKDQMPGDTSPDPSQIIKNGSSPGFPFIVKSDDNDNAVASAVPPGAPDQGETDPSGSMSYKSTETPSPIIRDNVTSQQQAHQPISSPGRPKGVTPKFSLKPLVPRLSELLGLDVVMANDCIGEEVEKLAAALPEGGVLLLENVRFYKEEEKNDPEFAKKLASVADLYVNDAFGTAHRDHASTEGVTKFLRPSVAGFLMQKELSAIGGDISMADGDSSDFTFCKVERAENDGHLDFPSSITVASMTIEDVDGNGVDISETKKIQDSMETKNPTTDGRSRSISSSIHSVSLQDSSVKEPTVPKSSAESVQSTLSPQPKSSKKSWAKVPFEKGYSPMDWLKLTRTHPDLAGLRGQTNRRLITLEEVKQHKTGDCIWTVLKGRVYNIGPYMKFHPGGVDMLMKGAGKDCTALFNKYHAWVNAEFLLEKCLVGFLDPNE